MTAAKGERRTDAEVVVDFLYKRCTGPEGHVIQAAERLVAALVAAEALADRNALLYIEASNPGIDMDEVRRSRAALSGGTGS
jgi:hypothetical protein